MRRAEVQPDHLVQPLARRINKMPGVEANASPRELNAFLASVEKRAFRIAQVGTQNRDEALDIVQDAMMQLAKRYAARPAEEWTPLFYRILNNKILDWQRRQTVKRRLFFWRDSAPADDEDDFDPIDNLVSATVEGADVLQREQAMKVLEAALRRLPARQRQAFELRIWEGLDTQGTAAAMGCTEGSVKTHLSRALHTLRAQLQGVWP